MCIFIVPSNSSQAGSGSSSITDLKLFALAYKHVFRYFSLDIFASFNISCYYSSYSYYVQLYYYTIIPLGIFVGGVLIFFTVKILRISQSLGASILTAIFYGLYFLLPIVTTTIFDLFKCIDLDPSNEMVNYRID